MTEELRSYIQEILGSKLTNGELNVVPLAGDASSRRYSRLLSGLKSWVLMEWEPFESENYPLLSVQTHFKKNHILVPEVVSYSERLGVIIYEDLGDVTLEQEFYKTRNPYSALGYYRMAMDELLKIHLMASKDTSSCVAFNVAFDIEKLSWEMDWTLKNFLVGVLNFNNRSDELEKEFKKLSTLLDVKEKYIQHRDYHSRNLMVYQNKLRVIDFQDARMGLVQYDLVSLLRDAYVPVPQALETELLGYYLSRAKEDFAHSWSSSEFEYLYEVQSIQRLFKAVGSFASFWVMRKDRRYLKYIPATMQRVKVGLEKLSEFKVLSTSLDECGAYDWSEEKI